MRVALTGGTGFLGGHVAHALVAAGHEVRALTRGRTPAIDGVEWSRGALTDTASLERLCAGVDAVVHVAGVVNAPDAAGFDIGNRRGTLAMLAAAGGARFVHISSLAAREPQLSNYGASKRAAEDAVVASGLDWRIVRPPAIYGPGDTENLELFRLAVKGIVPLPPMGRMSLIHAADLARLIATLVDSATPRLSVDADDGRLGGWSTTDYARAIGVAVGRPRVTTISMPKAMVRMVARLGLAPKLTLDRARYMCHPDWTIDPARRPDPDMWSPAIATEAGLAATADWYREAGWL